MDLRSIINNEGADGAQRKAAPVTPGPHPPHPPPQAYRASHPQQSPGPGSKHPSQDYGPPSAHPPPPRPSPGAYPSGYQGRSGPPLQTDLRSPISQYPAQSPFRQPSGSSAGGGQYPFPSQPPQSPAQPFPPNLQRVDSYPHHSQASPIQGPSRQYSQGSPVPQTPPVVTPGGHPYYPTARPQSSHSTPTPTSANPQQQQQQQQQHQQQYFNHQPHGSPVATHAYPPGQHQRQQSQPGTPLGPPPSTLPRQASTGYPQPQSPYQQRQPSTVPYNHPQHPQSSPTTSAAPVPLRQPSTPGTGNEVHGTPRSDISRRSQSERERTVSVSPKTRVSSQPRTDSIATLKSETSNGQSSPVKVKAELPEEQSLVQRKRESVPQMPLKKKTRYAEPPIWARSSLGRPPKTPLANGVSRPPRRQPSPPRAKTNGHLDAPPVRETKLPTASPAASAAKPEGLLGPWEPSITGDRPHEDIAKEVADFLFITVVNRADTAEFAKRGVNIEIEAKLGQLINKDTNDRVAYPIKTPCVLHNTGRTTFKSSMTDVQHRHLNEFLNAKLAEAHPNNPNQSKKRVTISYLHRRELDKFYELSPALAQNLPPLIQNALNPRHAVKVRVTHDQNSGQVLAKIIKARVADLDIYNPSSSLDCRISVNLEMSYDGDVEALKNPVNTQLPERRKDRLSYTHSHYQIDLTQVSVIEGGQVKSKEHELEIELSAQAVIDQGLRARNGQPHQYAELIEGLVDNVRVLSRVLS